MSDLGTSEQKQSILQLSGPHHILTLFTHDLMIQKSKIQNTFWVKVYNYMISDASDEAHLRDQPAGTSSFCSSSVQCPELRLSSQYHSVQTTRPCNISLSAANSSTATFHS